MWNDLNFWRSVVTVVSMVLFVALVVWTWRRSQQPAYDEAAQLPLVEEEPLASDAGVRAAATRN
ncbi:cbb3-type cytochrome oxidase subunit 3 [Ideonella livida]|nr:cbb3-type cytochrome c oxidase subunit 3 [Ideonella livida]